MKNRILSGLVGLSFVLIFFGNVQAQTFNDYFDSGLGSWTTTGSWALDSTTAHSQPGCITDSPANNYVNDSDSALTLSAPLNFSSATQPALHFFHRHAIEPDYDTATVEVSIDGGSHWDVIASYDGNQYAWQSEQLDLSDFSGESSVLFRFRLQTDSSVVHDGWYIDDVVIDEIPNKAVLTEVTAQGLSSVLVGWNAPADATIQRYRIYRSMISGALISDSVLIGETDGGARSITDFSIAPKNTFYYRVVAVDAGGFASVSDESQITLPAGMDFPFLDSGEAGPTHWLAEGDWSLAQEPGNPANQCWSDSPEKPYTNAVNASLTLVAPLDLSSATAPAIAFRQKHDLAVGDIVSVEISITGGDEWTSLQSFTAGTTTNQWTQENISLTDYIGDDSVLIRFWLTTTTSGTADGFWIDDIAVAEAPSAVTSLLIDQVQSHSVRAGWTQNIDTLFSHYAVYRKLGSSGVSFHDELVGLISDQAQTQFTDTGLLLNSDYVYRAYGVSSYGTLSLVTAEQNVLTANHPTPYADDFEGNVEGWVLLGNWNIETDGTNSWMSDSPGAFYGNNQRDSDNYALTAVDLSDATWPVLSFRDKFNLTGNDRAYLQTSINGTSWITRYVVTGQRNEWLPQQIDLSEWAGQPNLRIRFYLYSDGSANADGWQIDDISVTEHVPAAAQALPLIERFEDAAINWLNGGWSISTNEAYEGAASAQSPPIPFTPGYSDIYASLGLELNMAGSTAPQLTLWAKGIDSGYCRLYAQLSNNGGISWTDISGDMDAKPDQWKRFQFAVPAAFQVDGVRLRLRAYTTNYDQPTEFYIDKLTVEETPTWVTLNTPAPNLKSIDLNWSTFADAGTFQKYEIYRRESANVTVSDTLAGTITDRLQTNFTDSNLSIGKTYYYRVMVYNLNDTATPSNEGQGTTVPVTLPISDTLDDLALWDTIGNWGIETSATESWLSDSPDQPYGNNQRDSDNYALTAVDLSDATWPVLSFTDKFNLTGNDRAYLQTSINGTSWITRYVVTGQRTEWLPQQIDLSEWAGQPNLRIRFYLYSDGSATADGWQIDDISVTEHVPAAAQALPLIERFEDGAANWLNGGWSISTNEAYEGGASAQSLPIPFTPGYSDIYANLGFELNMAGSTAPQLTLWAKGIDSGYCRLYAQLSNNGGISWTDISGDMDAKPDQWKRFQFAVPAAFKVDGVRLRLRAYTTNYDQPTEFYIDKLTVEETPTWVTLNTPAPNLKSIDLNWSTFADAGTFQKYEIYRRESANVTVSDTLAGTITDRLQTNFTDSNLSIGKTYYYRVMVYNLNDTATPSNEAQGTTVPVTLPISDTLDDLALWDTIGNWGIETSATESWLSDSPDQPYGNNQRDTDNYALTAVDLSGATWPVLSFRDKFNLTGNDRAYLQTSINGTSWITRYVVTGQRNEWLPQQIDLSEWAGQPNLRIRFYLYSDGSATADGWQIDDISVTEHVPAAAQALPLIERFEDAAINWLNGGWSISTNEAYEGNASAQSPPIPFTPGYSDIYANLGFELNMAGSTAPQLTLWAKGIDSGYCRLYAQLSNNGGISWTDISGDMDAKPDQWKRFQFAVPAAFLVDGVRLRLRAYTTNYDQPTEFYIDKLTVEETPTWVTLNTPAAHLKSIDLNWSTFGDAGTFQKYEIYRRESANVTVSDTLAGTITDRLQTNFTDSNLSIGKTYYYRVMVYNLNDTATPSNEGQGTTVPVTLPINDTLDDLALWDTIGNWGIETAATESWLSDSPDQPYGNNQRDSDNYALTAVDLSDATWPVLSFTDKFNLTGNDRGYLQISKNGTSWSTRYVVTGERLEWSPQQVDLSEWNGEPNVRIRFYLYTDGSATDDGWQIDDISIAEHVPAVQALPMIERFQDGASNWLNGGWSISTNEAYEGAASAQSLPIPFTPGYSDIYANLGLELNMAGSTAPQLTLWAKGIDSGYCRLYAQLSNNGGISWTDISGDMDAKPDQWKRFQFAIPVAFQVDGVRLRLRAYTTNYDQPTEFYIDRLAIGEEAPGVPTPLAPANAERVEILNPTLTVINSIDIVDDNSSYAFQVYTNENLAAGSLVTEIPVLASGDATTGWRVDIDMVDGQQYWWRCRATSSSGFESEWSRTNTFHVVIVNHAPTVPMILSPYANATLPDASGSFIWLGSSDSDATDFVAEYRIEVASDESFSAILLSTVEPEDNTIGLVSLNSMAGYESLPLDASYFWRVCAVDSQGLASAWASEPFVYGSILTVLPEPATITGIEPDGSGFRIEWTPSEQVSGIEFSPTLEPAAWWPVAAAQHLQTNFVTVVPPTNSPAGFFRVITGEVQ